MSVSARVVVERNAGRHCIAVQNLVATRVNTQRRTTSASAGRGKGYAGERCAAWSPLYRIPALNGRV